MFFQLLKVSASDKIRRNKYSFGKIQNLGGPGLSEEYIWERSHIWTYFSYFNNITYIFPYIYNIYNTYIIKYIYEIYIIYDKYKL